MWCCKLIQRSKYNKLQLFFYNITQWRIKFPITFQQFLAKDNLCWEMPSAFAAYLQLYADMFRVLLECKVTTGTWQKQVVISWHHHANAARWFSSLIFCSGVPPPEKVKNYSLHWAYIDLFFPKDSIQPGFGQKLLWEEPTAWAKTSRSLKLFNRPLYHFSNGWCAFCIFITQA